MLDTTPKRVFSAAALPAAAINHLLAQEPWARELLLPYCGKIVAISSEVLTLKFQISAGGLLAAADNAPLSDVTIKCKVADIPLILRQPERAVSYIKLEGEAGLAHAFAELGQRLRPEPAHELTPLVGEIAAKRISDTTQKAVNHARQTRQKLLENVAEYFLEEQPLLVRPLAVDDFAACNAQLRDDVERLEKRIDKITRKLQANG